MALTVEEFKRRWETDNPPITNNDCADCAIAWGITPHPKTMPIQALVIMVLAYAEIDYSEYL